MTERDLIDPPPFLAPSPPPWAARALATLLLTLFAAGAAALILIEVPETVSAPFVVTPRHGNDPVRALHAGTIGRIEVQDAQAVKQGQVLFMLVSEPVGDRSAERENLDVRLEGRSGRLTNERQKYVNKQHADEQEVRRLSDRLANLERLAGLKTEQLALAKEIAAKMQQSLDSGVSSWMDASKPQLDVQRLEAELQQVRVDQADAQGLLARLQFEMASDTAAFKETERAIGEEARGFAARKSALEADPSPREGSALSITSPCDGTIVRLHVNAAATVVHEGDTLAEIVCAGERLQAELQLPERGLALARPGQTVKLMYDAFPYERYGVRFGTLRWVSPASAADPQGGAFRALADLDAETVGVQGQRRPILAGMTGRAAVIVGRRSLASYAIEPLRQLRESIAAERPARGETR